MYGLVGAAPVTHELVAAVGGRPAVLVTFNPQPTLLSIRAGRRAAVAILRAGGEHVEERAGDAFTDAVIRHNIRAWDGIGNAAGEPVEPTPDKDILDDEGNIIGVEFGTISDFLAEPRLVEAADRLYILPWAKADAEKNGLSLSPNGTSARATEEADTASSPATQESRDVVETTTEAPPVPTTGTKRKPRKAKPSGN